CTCKKQYQPGNGFKKNMAHILHEASPTKQRKVLNANERENVQQPQCVDPGPGNRARYTTINIHNTLKKHTFDFSGINAEHPTLQASSISLSSTMTPSIIKLSNRFAPRGSLLTPTSLSLHVSSYRKSAIPNYSNKYVYEFGRRILEKGGSAVDAAIAVLFCQGVADPHRSGIGGGMYMLIYQREKRSGSFHRCSRISAKLAHADMFQENRNGSLKVKICGMSIAVPGELLGLWEAHKRFGVIPWKELVEPSIHLCEEGVTIQFDLAKCINRYKDIVVADPVLKEMFTNPNTGEVLKSGDIMKNHRLGKTLRMIAESGPSCFYNGSLTTELIADIQRAGGILQPSDLHSYNPEWITPVTTQLKDNITLYTVPLPGSGILLIFILNILNGFIPTKNTITNFQRIIETFKYGYGKRTHFGDPKFVDNKTISELIQQLTSKSYAESIRQKISNSKTSQDPAYYDADVIMPEDHGTSHITVLAPNGDAVSVTTTINLPFGAVVRSKSTGIILNNEMDDFFVLPNIINSFGMPPSPNNFIKPGKRPVSSMVPSIFIDMKGDVQLIAEELVETKITSSTALVAAKVLWFNMTIKEAIEEPRMHHQLFPMHIEYENGIPENIIEGLKKIGHKVKELNPFLSFVSGIVMKDGKIYAYSDSRRQGVAAGF
ncbi:hypothetical protein L9F63_025893, partial [Diploptera punctata]